MRPIPRYLGLVMLLVMAGVAAVGFMTIRRDVQNLRELSQDNILWSATQIELELLRFELSLAILASEKSQEALDEVRKRYDLLLSRLALLENGRVGKALRAYDEGYGSISDISANLNAFDPTVMSLKPDDTAAVGGLLESAQEYQKDLRQYSLRVVRGDRQASAAVRDSIQSSAQITAIISLAAVILGVMSLLLILRESRRQRQIADLHRQSAEEADLASRAKSRFLSMMSHELRNPLNGVLGPLALLGQSDLGNPQKRLITQAQHSGQSMLQMLSGLLDYGEMQDGQFVLNHEPVRVTDLAGAVRSAFEGQGAKNIRIDVAPGTPEAVEGDLDRLCQIFLHLGEFVLEARGPGGVDMDISWDKGDLVGNIAFDGSSDDIRHKLDLLMGLSDIQPDQVTTDALRPLIAQGLIAAVGGSLTIEDQPDGRKSIHVRVPAGEAELARVRVHLETRSAALATIYRAALRSDQVVFAEPDDTAPVDVVLVDATSTGADPLMSGLRKRFPDAVYVALGLPEIPSFFDHIVETPTDIIGLRTSILGKLAS